MSPELIPYASTGLVACAALATLLGLRRHSRRFMDEVQRFTAALGLRAEGPRFVGEIEQVPVRMMVRTISVRFEDDSPGVCQVTSIALPIARAQRWVLFDRDERFKDPLPRLDKNVTTGDAKFDRIYGIQVEGEPPAPGWKNALIRRNILQCKLVRAVGLEEKLTLDFHQDSDHPDRMKRALLTAVSMVSTDCFGRFRLELEKPPERGIPFPVTLGAFVLSVLAAAAPASMGLGFGDEWTDWSVAFAVLYLPVLGILALGQLLWRRRPLRS